MFTATLRTSDPPCMVANMDTVKIRLRELMREKTIRDGRDPEDEPITQLEVSKAIGVAEGTLGSWARNSVEKLDKQTLARLCRYFQCEIGDLLRLDLED